MTGEPMVDRLTFVQGCVFLEPCSSCDLVWSSIGPVSVGGSLDIIFC